MRRRLGRSWWGFLRNDCGAAALEFALILPVLLTMIAGFVEFGRVLYAQNAIRAVIDEAARTAVVQDLTVAETKILVEDDLDTQVNGVIGDVPCVVTVTDGTAITITVEGTYNVIFADFLTSISAQSLSFSLTSRYPK